MKNERKIIGGWVGALAYFLFAGVIFLPLRMEASVDKQRASGEGWR